MNPMISEIQANVLMQERHREAAAWRAAGAARDARRERRLDLRRGTTVPGRSRWSRTAWLHQAPKDAALPR